MISYSRGPQNLNLNGCKNDELQNTLIRCEKVDFPYISCFHKNYNNFQYKAVFFCSAKSRSYVSEAILIAQKLYPITLLINNQVYKFKKPFIPYGSYRKYTRMYKPQQLSIPFDRAFLDMKVRIKKLITSHCMETITRKSILAPRRLQRML